jgi:TfoX/Sxy family transcriptional regulator of competence genes
MASTQKTVDYLLEQMAGAGQVSARKMFGEYGVYCGEKMAALICDNQLFVKPTPAGRELLQECVEAPPYPGAKLCYLISGELWEDAQWLSRLIRVTAAQLPLPAAKKKR